jgi:hypothetical protein
MVNDRKMICREYCGRWIGECERGGTYSAGRTDRSQEGLCPGRELMLNSKFSHYRSNKHITPIIKGKVKCTLVQALRLCTCRTVHRGSRDIVLLFHDHGTRKGWGVSVTPRPLFTPGKEPVPIVQEAGWVGPRTGLDRCEKSFPHRDSIPRPSSP